MNNREIYTIGHSNHAIDYFLELLKHYAIDCVIDVRSIPASAYNPQFNKTPLKHFLKNNSILYMHFGKEFGARHTAVELLDNEGIVDFETVQKTRLFQNGVERVDIGISKGYKIALMCSEGNPLECHRFSMISGYLEQQGIKVKHILKNKELASNEALENKLLKKYDKKLPKPNLFEPTVDEKLQLKMAYKFHNKEVGWKAENFTN